MKFPILNIFLLCITFQASAQSETKSILIKVDSLKNAVYRLDTLSTDEIWQGDDSANIHSQISKLLIDILSSPKIINYNIDSIFKTDFNNNLNIVHSKDNRLWIFNWHEKTGGTFQSNISLIHYRTKLNKPKVVYDYYSDSASTFCSNGAWFTKIYKLPNKHKNLYLCIGSIKGCTSCCAEIATVVELTADNIKSDYPAFRIKKPDEDPSNSSCFMLDARCGDIEKFEYSVQKAAINYTYYADDRSPTPGDNEKINKTLRWNGYKFIEPRKN